MKKQEKRSNLRPVSNLRSQLLETGLIGLKTTKAFTLVELIVVITILAILGTIAFISMQSYSAHARDSVRISDIGKMKTALELFQLDAGKYPEPTDGFVVTYFGREVWTQGTFGTTTFSNISKLDKIPTDPLTNKEYTYSVTKTKQEYQFAGIVESDDVSLNKTLIGQTLAGDLIATALVTGTYNGQIIKTESGTNCNILSLPSIVSSEPNTITDLSVILTNKSLVYNGYKNLPTNYITSKYKTDDGFMFTSNKIVVYDDSASCAPLYNPEDNTARVELITNLQEAYSGTLIENNDGISGIVNIDLTDSVKLDIISATIVSNNLGGSIAFNSNGGTETSTNSCSTQPSYTHATFTVGTPTSVNQEYVKDATNCGYTCTDGYTGPECDLAPGQLTSKSTCESVNWLWVDDTTDTIGNGFCISPRVTGGTESISWMDIGTSYGWTRTNASPMTAANAYADNLYGVTYDLGNYSCKSLGTSISGFTKLDNSDSTLSSDDTIENRMRYLAKYKTDSTKIDDVNIDWITFPSIPTGFSVPALYLSDCIDGTRDLNTGKTYDGVDYETYSDTNTNTNASRTLRNRYLLGWTKQVGSHLPSAYSDISSEIADMLTVNKGEYQIACEAGKFGTVTGTAGNLTGSEDDTANKWIRLSAVGVTTSGTYWGSNARIVGTGGCGDQYNYSAGYSNGAQSARFVVRP